MTGQPEPLARFPAERGTYVLLLHMEAPTPITVGKRGTFAFAAGWYAYVGSAFGPGGLRGRLKHHLTPLKTPHWHIDYLRSAAPVCEVWYIARTAIYEHEWAAALRSLPGAQVPVPRFGASDCRCAAHLVYFADRPMFEGVCQHLGLRLQRYQQP